MNESTATQIFEYPALLQLFAESLIAQIALVLALTVIATIAQRIIVGRLAAHSKKTDNILDDAVINALGAPLLLLIWLIGILFALHLASDVITPQLSDALPTARTVSIVFIVCWFLLRVTKNFELGYIGAKKDDADAAGLVDVASKAVRILIAVIGLLACLQALGVSIAGLLALGGVGGIAVGFAARELIANYFGGVMVYMERPFKVGETIASPDKDIEGTVEQISWGQTVIRRFDSRTLYVPNSLFNSIAIRNNTRQSSRRIYEYVGIRYDDADKLEAIIADVREMLKSHKDLNLEESNVASFDRFAASSLDFFIWCHTKTKSWEEFCYVKQDVLIRVMNIIAEHGAQVAFPTSTVHVPNKVHNIHHFSDEPLAEETPKAPREPAAIRPSPTDDDDPKASRDHDTDGGV